ncbi:MAG: hypothetical protein ABWZ15_04015 [Acidimicrobiia bacterium]
MRRHRRVAIAAAILTLVVAAGCGGDDDDDDAGGSETTETTAPAEATETTDTPDTTAAVVDEEAEKAAAGAALEQFFTAFSAADFVTAAALLENGDELQPTMQGLYDTFMVATNALGAAAKSETLTSADEAEVIYDLSFGGAVALPDTSALMVKEDGQWKVSESTWNALLALAPADS